MPTEKWSGSLGHVAERLRRALGWTSAGDFPLEFNRPSQLQPVALADDSTRPGANAYSERNRRWMYPNQMDDQDDQCWIGVGADTLGKGVIVDRVQFSIEKQAPCQLWIQPPGIVGTGAYPAWVDAAITAVQRGPLFVEGNRSLTDFAPMFWAVSTNAVPSGSGQLIWNAGVGDVLGAGGDIGRVVTIPLEIYLQPGGWLYFTPGSAILELDFQVTFFGRSF